MKNHKFNFEKIIYAITITFEKIIYVITITAFALLILAACVCLSAWLIEVTFFG